MEHIISLSVGFLYLGFVNRLLNHINKIGDNPCQTNNNECNDNYRKKVQEMRDKIFTQSLIISVVSLIISAYYYSSNKTFSFGLGLGSLFLIIYHLVLNWHKISDNQRMII
jgi:hypothetical protein